MYYKLDNESEKFFALNGYIAFSGLIDEEKIDLVKKEIEKTSKKRLEKKGMKEPNPFDIFSSCHDIFHASDLLKDFISNKKFHEILKQLIHKNTFRIGFDQAFCSNLLFSSSQNFHDEKQRGKFPIFEKPVTLERISSLQSILGGILIALKNKNKKSEKSSIEENKEKDKKPSFSYEKSKIVFFSQEEEKKPPIILNPKEVEEGDILFINKNTLIDFSTLFEEETLFYLIAFSTPATVYIDNSLDPNRQYLKSLGYAIGDKLKDSTHPPFSY